MSGDDAGPGEVSHARGVGGPGGAGGAGGRHTTATVAASSSPDGVATATACALLGLDCVIYMGGIDTARQ
ncbi:hypothetical protein, partial [Mycobacterium tuberculosis]|uniref:hypothetical protein n=1 Tax=Mycobacterium tuberculosis TaxID=1773 RepID=UPI0012485C4A